MTPNKTANPTTKNHGARPVNCNAGFKGNEQTNRQESNPDLATMAKLPGTVEASSVSVKRLGMDVKVKTNRPRCI